ncbi:hypothetical protein LEN26_017701 [Aphanomyces euteiches]|nr:hypothetical protein LEN26_017701 [Aphanomyces euteiches]
MTCTVLRFKCDPNSTLAKGLLEALCTLLEMVSGNNFRLQNAAVKYVVDICKQSASTFEQLFEMICATPSTANIEMGSTKFRATKILIENFVGLLEPNNRLRLLSNFTFWAFESKYRPRASELKSFDDFLNTVSSEEFAAVVEPVMSRMLKKSPDSLLEATTLMTSALRFDFDRYIDNVFIPIFTLKIRSQKDDVRDNCVGLIEAVISRCGDLRPAQTILVELLNVLEGKHGILAQSYQREAVFLSLYNISKHLDSLDSSGAIELANLCIPRLIKVANKEANETARSLGVLTVSKWLLPLKSAPIPDEVGAIFLSGLQNKSESTVVAYSRAILSVCDTLSEYLKMDSKIISELVRLVQVSNKKPNILHLVGLISICALAILWSKHKEISQVLDIEMLFTDESFFFSTSVGLLLQATSGASSLIETIEVTTLKSVSSVICCLLSHSEPPRSLHLYKILVGLLNHQNLTVRSSCLAEVKMLVSENKRHSIALIDAMSDGLSRIKTKTIATDDNSCDKNQVTSISGILRKNLRTILPETIYEEDLVVQIFPRALLLAHHPLVVQGNRKDYFCREWDNIKGRFVESVDEELTLHDAVDDLFAFIPGLRDSTNSLVSSYLLSTEAQHRTSAHRVIVTLLDFAGSGSGESLVHEGILRNFVATRLSDENVVEISRQDVEIYNTPEGTLYEVVKIKDEKPTVRSRGTEDEKWEQQVREEIERKRLLKGKSEEKKKLTKEEHELLSKQSLIRQRLASAKTTVAHVERLLFFLSATSPQEFQPSIPYLLSPCLKLLENPFFSEDALVLIRHLCRSVMPASLRTNSNQLAYLLKTSHLASCHENVDDIKAYAETFEHLFSVLVETVFGYVLSSEDEFDLNEEYVLLNPPTFHLVYPIIKIVMEKTLLFRRFVVPLFSAHAKMIKEEEEMEIGDMAAQRMLRASMINLTLSWLSHDEKVGSITPDLILSQLCAGPPLSPDEWNPILGDNGLLSAKSSSRLACLKAILNIDEESLNVDIDSLITCYLFLSKFDKEEQNKTVAADVWSRYSLTLPEDYIEYLLPLLGHKYANIREASGAALANAMTLYGNSIPAALSRVRSLFVVKESKDSSLDEVDAFGIPSIRRNNKLEEGLEEQLPRIGVGICLGYCASEGVLSHEYVLDTLKFIIERGLGDSNSDVRQHMRKAGIQIIERNGAVYTSELLAILETPFESTGSSPQEIASHDHQKESVVVLLGSLAKHMDKSDPKVIAIIQRLMDSLSIPSESVQRAIAICLSPLIPSVKERSAVILDELLEKATQGATYGDRMGAAFGISAVVKGLGIAALKQHAIIPRLEEAMKNSNPNSRQGALIVIECLCERLGFLFEPYVIVILPILLKSFADTNPQVREAASLTSKGIMRHLSAHGVKLVLPSILRAVDDSAWRTKHAAIQLLGAMASCAPKQLGSCLPQIIPKLTESFSDSHPRVKEAGHTAMNDIAQVIRNPEISSISSVLLAGLQDPNRKTNEALQALQSMVFVHSIDAPSMALIMPILQRGLTDRLSETKKKAALIVGNMCSMVNDAKDLVPYLDSTAPCLQIQLLDPIPEVRTIASKALGMLVKGLGQSHFPSLVQSLLSAMKSDGSSVERSGSAQGLCEVLVALGLDPLDTYLREEIFPLARHPKASVREGLLWVIAFLPPALGKTFAKYLNKALPMVVAGLSDESEGVREVAMHAGSIVVNAHALSHTKDILPALEAGIFDDNWRIRQSSISLLGDLLYRVSGSSGKVVYVENNDSDDDDDDSIGNAAGERAMLKILGKSRRDLVLSSLYMARSDTSAIVRQSALQVWKSVVSNTPKTLKTILETLMNSIVQSLAGDNPEKQAVAGRTLGDIVSKLGERVMPEVVPILRSGLSPHNPEGMRQGVCLGLAEVIGCSPKKQLEDFVETLVDALEEALCDENIVVRAAAGQAFDVFHKSMGYRSIDEVVPRLLKRIQSSNDDTQLKALLGLQEMVTVKSREVLPYLIPRLLTTPLTHAHVQAIARIAAVSGSVIHYHIDRIMSVLFAEYVNLHENLDMAQAIKESLKALALGVEDAGVQWLSSEMCKYCESDTVQMRYLACWLVSTFCESTLTNYNEQVPIFIKYILQRFNDSDPAVVQAASDSFNSLNSTIRPEELSKHIDFMRNNLNALVSDARHRKGGVGSGEFLLPALCIPKGLDPFLPSYLHALMNGTPETRQSAAAGLGELVLLANATCLKSVLIKLTGPLIRIAGDRFPSHVKSAILSTLEILLNKGGAALKPFLPQLQTTFVKALNDPSGEVRSHGGSALTQLVKLSQRVDPLMSELSDRLVTSNGGVKEACLSSIVSILNSVGGKVSQPVLLSLLNILQDSLDSEEDVLRTQACICTGFIFGLLENGEGQFLDTIGCIDASSVWTRRHSSALICEHVLVSKCDWVDNCVPRIVDLLYRLSGDEKPVVRTTSLQAMVSTIQRSSTSISNFVPPVAKCLGDSQKDVNRAALRVVKKMAKQEPTITRTCLHELVPLTFQHIKSTNISVKFAAERALLYLLEIHTRPDTLIEYSNSSDQGKLLTEYSRRVLSKLKAEGDSD